MVTADVVVMAKSSFSFVPALLNAKATVLYSPFWHPALPGWQTVSNEILKKGSLDLRELQANVGCRDVRKKRLATASRYYIKNNFCGKEY